MTVQGQLIFLMEANSNLSEFLNNHTFFRPLELSNFIVVKRQQGERRTLTIYGLLRLLRYLDYLEVIASNENEFFTKFNEIWKGSFFNTFFLVNSDRFLGLSLFFLVFQLYS